MFHAYGLGNSLTFPFSVGATVVLEPSRPPTPLGVAERVAATRRHALLLHPDVLPQRCSLPTSRRDLCLGALRGFLPPRRSRPRRSNASANGSASRFSMASVRPSSCTSTCPTAQWPPSPGRAAAPCPATRREWSTMQATSSRSTCPANCSYAALRWPRGIGCRTEMSRATFEGEWMRTGDLYSCDGDGFHTYLGRVDDMLRVGGEWVSPAEVEATLIEHPSVLEAAIVGQPDDGGVMRPVAFVVAAASGPASADELTAHCRERLAGYKRPSATSSRHLAEDGDWQNPAFQAPIVRCRAATSGLARVVLWTSRIESSSSPAAVGYRRSTRSRRAPRGCPSRRGC